METSNNKNKLGLFIHWGVYSVLGLHEQALSRYHLDAEKYEAMAMKFNPVAYDPEKWVLAAKNAGFQYICFTAKHHDGFCMWDTKFTNYNIMNTPYGQDVLKMLADACQKHGILLSIYYSNPDWHCEYGYNPAASRVHQRASKNKDKPDVPKYTEYVKNQIRELMSNYGKIYTLFWDIPPFVVDESVNQLVRSLQPEIYINDRGYDAGDFSTPERDYAAIGGSRFRRMTEACNSIGVQSWGYRYNEDYYSVRYLTCCIDRIMAMGGSYLLNVGPKADGSLGEIAYDRLAKVGDWYNRMGGCLEQTQEDSWEYDICTNPYIVNRKDGKSYFHFYEGLPANGVVFQKYPSLPKSVRLVNTNSQLSFAIEDMPMISEGCLHISQIPIDELQSEPIVIEIEW